MQTIKELLEGARLGKPTVFEVTDILDGETKMGNRLEITLKEDSKPAPIRAESQARAHRFHDVPGFVAYLRKYATKQTVVLGCQPQSIMYAVVDEEAEKGRETVVMQPMVHPLWTPWRQSIGREMDLDAFLQILRANRRSVAKPDARELILALSQIEAKTEITLHVGKGRKCLNGLLIKSEIQGTKHEEVVELPDALTLKVPLFIGRPAAEVEVDVSIQADQASHQIHVLLSSGDMARAELAEFEDMLAECREELADTSIVFALGEAAYRPWQYQP